MELELFKVHIVVELDDVDLLGVLLLWVQWHLNVDPRYTV